MEPANSPNPIQLWYVNNFEVRLLQNHDSLEYETFDTINKKTVYKESFDLIVKTKEQMISNLQKCRVMIGEEGKPFFSHNYHTWGLVNYDVNLIKGANGLIWDIFCNLTENSSFISLQESTIPSAICHPETVAIIDKIKNECFKDPLQIVRLRDDFKVVRVLELETQDSERALAIRKEINEFNELNFESIGQSIGAFGINVLGKAVAGLSASSISTVSGTVTSFFGGGAIGSFLGTSSVTAISTITAASSLALPAISFGALYCIYNSISNKRENLISKLKSLPPLKPICIEIEPKITAPSLIDNRVLVSKFTWAVTLVSHKGPTCIGIEPNKFSEGNHAEIYIEGINDGFYNEKSPLIRNAKPIAIGEKFIHLAHLMPPIESGLLSPNELEFETRSEIWMVTSDKVKTMLGNIEIEKTLPKGQRHEFNKWGEGAILGVKGHNCFTWARYHLKTININLGGKQMPPNLTGFLAAIVTDYTKKPTKYTETTLQRI